MLFHITKRSFIICWICYLFLNCVSAWISLPLFPGSTMSHSSRSSDRITNSHRCDKTTQLHVIPTTATTTTTTTRRGFLMTSGLTSTFTFITSVASAKEEDSIVSNESQTVDPWETMNDAIQQQGWPNSASPLPIPSGNRSQSTGSGSRTNETKTDASDLEAALQQASKKKQVDPRTHG